MKALEGPNNNKTDIPTALYLYVAKIVSTDSDPAPRHECRRPPHQQYPRLRLWSFSDETIEAIIQHLVRLLVIQWEATGPVELFDRLAGDVCACYSLV